MGPFLPRQDGRQATERNHAYRLQDHGISLTPLQCLPVLSHIAPPAVRRTKATTKFISYIQTKPQLPANSDIFHHPASRLKSRRPIWFTDTVSSAEKLWRESWEVNSPVNSYITDEPTALVPDFDLHRREWCLLNHFCCDTGRCAARLHQWSYSDNPLCICGDIQSMSHIINHCPVNKCEGGLATLHTASNSAREWLRRVHCIR